MLERELILSYEDMHLNFLVAEDGRAYEAEGWHKTWNEKHQEKKAVVVAFSGSFNSYSPHENIFLALQSVIEEGLRLGKLSTSYKIVTEKAFDPESEQIGTLLLEKIHKLDRHIEILNV